MRYFTKDEKGSVLALSAFIMFLGFLFCAPAIDGSHIFVARNQLQSAADAAALAGASGLLISKSEATVRAIDFASFNTCIKQSVSISPGHIFFPKSNRIRVRTERDLDLFFAPVIGLHTAHVTAVAEAEAGNVVGADKLKPWAVPKMSQWPVGTMVMIKSGSLGAPATNPSFFYPVNYPPLNRGRPVPGAGEYRYNIRHGSKEEIFINDIPQVEPGNMVGPTKQGVDYLISLDPSAYFDFNSNSVKNSDYPGYSSPRNIRIPLYDPNNPPDSGKKTSRLSVLPLFFCSRCRVKMFTGFL